MASTAWSAVVIALLACSPFTCERGQQDETHIAPCSDMIRVTCLQHSDHKSAFEANNCSELCEQSKHSFCQLVNSRSGTLWKTVAGAGEPLLVMPTSTYVFWRAAASTPSQTQRHILLSSTDRGSPALNTLVSVLGCTSCKIAKVVRANCTAFSEQTGWSSQLQRQALPWCTPEPPPQHQDVSARVSALLLHPQRSASGLARRRRRHWCWQWRTASEARPPALAPHAPAVAAARLRQQTEGSCAYSCSMREGKQLMSEKDAHVLKFQRNAREQPQKWSSPRATRQYVFSPLVF